MKFTLALLALFLSLVKADYWCTSMEYDDNNCKTDVIAFEALKTDICVPDTFQQTFAFKKMTYQDGFMEQDEFFDQTCNKSMYEKVYKNQFCDNSSGLWSMHYACESSFDPLGIITQSIVLITEYLSDQCDENSTFRYSGEISYTDSDIACMGTYSLKCEDDGTVLYRYNCSDYECQQCNSITFVPGNCTARPDADNIWMSMQCISAGASMMFSVVVFLLAMILAF